MLLPCFLCGGVRVVVFSIWFSYGVVAVLFSNFVTFSPPLSKKHVPNVDGQESTLRFASHLLARNKHSVNVSDQTSTIKFCAAGLSIKQLLKKFIVIEFRDLR